jgi:dipeptidyl aminopeptidase/acylaminoacyl peptidase
VAHVGVFDLELMREEGDIPELLFGSKYLDEAIGDDEALLAKFSPVNHIDKLTIPVFIAHGKRDKRVPFEHAERLRDALDKQNKDYEWFVKDSESHGFFNEENRAEYFVKVSEFLAEHLD